MLKGRATAAATKNYADTIWQHNPKISPNSWKIMEGLTIGEIGYGAYRLDGSEGQISALKQALLSGVNLIDTSSNYTNGYSEAAIGDTLKNLTEGGHLTREQVVIVSKGGYLQGDTLNTYRSTPPTEYVHFNDQLWHCIHPSFLEEQLNNSLKRLNVETIDCYLLHNPEYYLVWAQNQGIDKQEAENEYYRRIQEAFVFLENMCQMGKIAFYGISSNTFTQNKSAYDFTNLQKIHEAAQFAAAESWGRRKRPLFRCIQLPYNLLEPAAVREINNTAKIIDGQEEVSTLELATRMRLSVLANRPLNAFPRPDLALKLADTPQESSNETVEDVLKHAGDIETELSTILGGWPNLHNQPLFSVKNDGPELLQQIENSLHLEYMFHAVLAPQMNMMAETLELLCEQYTEKSESLKTILNTYKQLKNRLHMALKHEIRTKDAARAAIIATEVKKRIPKKWQQAPLQQIALNAVASTPGITCVLNGMRDVAYVKDAIEVMQRSDFIDAGAVIGVSE